MALRSRSARRRSGEWGTSMVEMAVVTPLLLLLLFGIAELGLAFAQWQTLSNAAREGARVGVVFRDSAVCASNAQSEVENAVTTYAATMIQQTPSVSVTGLCSGPGTMVTVTATVPYTFQVLPNIQALLGGGGANTITIASTSAMRNE